jgi:hypothetical protein
MIIMVTVDRATNKSALRKVSTTPLVASLAFMGCMASTPSLPIRLEAQQASYQTVLDPSQRTVDLMCLRIIRGAVEAKAHGKDLITKPHYITEGKSEVTISLQKKSAGPNLFFYSDAGKIFDVEYTIRLSGTISTSSKDFNVDRYYVVDKSGERVMSYSYVEQGEQIDAVKILPGRVAMAAYALKDKEFRGGIILPEGRIADISFPDNPPDNQTVFINGKIKDIGTVIKVKMYQNATAFKNRDTLLMKEVEYVATKNGEIMPMKKEF